MHIRTRVHTHAHTHAHVHTAYTITCTFKEQAILHSTTDRWRMNISSNMNYRNIFVVYDDLNGKEIQKRGDTYVYIAGFPWWLSRKESTCKTGGCGFYPWVGKIPWRKKWQPIPVPLHRRSHGSWQGTVHGVAKSQTRLSSGMMMSSWDLGVMSRALYGTPGVSDRPP